MEESPIGIGFVTGASASDLRFLRQMGVTDVVSSLGGVEPGAVWEFEPMLALKNKVENAGLRLSVFEGIPVTDRILLISGRAGFEVAQKAAKDEKHGKATKPVQKEITYIR